MGDADGIPPARASPTWASTWHAIRASTGHGRAQFNVCDFTRKQERGHPPHSRGQKDLLVAGISLPIFMPPVRKGRHALRRLGLDQGRQPYRSRGARGRGTLGAVVHRQHGRLPRRAVQPVRPHDRDQRGGALNAEFDWIRDLNARILRGDSPYGQTRPIRLHVIKPKLQFARRLILTSTRDELTPRP